MSRLHLFRGVYKHNILLSGRKKMNLPVLVNDQLEKRIKIRQRGGEQKQKPHSDLEENDIHSKSAVTLAFSSFYDFSSPPPLTSHFFYCLLFSSFAQDSVFFTLLSSSLDKSTRIWGKGSGKREIPILTFISSVTLTKSTNLLFPLL